MHTAKKELKRGHNIISCRMDVYTYQWLPKHTIAASLLHTSFKLDINYLNSILSYASITVLVCGGEILLPWYV